MRTFHLVSERSLRCGIRHVVHLCSIEARRRDSVARIIQRVRDRVLQERDEQGISEPGDSIAIHRTVDAWVR